MMKNNVKEGISKVNLQKIIDSIFQTRLEFCDLDYNQKLSILEYIYEHKINLRVFKEKYYDILTTKFYAVEYKYNEDLKNFKVESIIFDTFHELYNYIVGDIYENTCFYGYKFTANEIKTYNLDLKKINIKALISKSIEEFSFDNILNLKKKESEEKSKEIERLKNWFDSNFAEISNLNSKKEIFYSLFGAKLQLSDGMFFSRTFTNKHYDKDYITDYFAAYDFTYEFNIDNLLIIFGIDITNIIIDKIETYGFVSESKIRNYRNRVDIFQNGNLQFCRKKYFDTYKYSYIVEDCYENNTVRTYKNLNYFFSFDEFVDYLHGDLCGANLENAPIRKEMVLDYKIDNLTKLPLSTHYDTYRINKFYNGEKYIVQQSWYFNGDLILNDEHVFEHFFDFVFFLDGDLSNADLIMCNGLENIVGINLKLEGLRAKSIAIKTLKLPFNKYSLNQNNIENFDIPSKYEIESQNAFDLQKVEDYDYEDKVAYISDIHLLHRVMANKCETEEDVVYTLRSISSNIVKNSENINLIVGDTTSDLSLFNDFIKELSKYNLDLNYKIFSHRYNHYFFTLGNHELWPFENLSINEISNKYKKILSEFDHEHLHLVQNNLFYLDEHWNEISENDLQELSNFELRQITRSAKLLIFGGIGFSGKNLKFNADNGIYRKSITREQEIEETNKFKRLYDKVINTFKDKNLIILSHMPIDDWNENRILADHAVYVNGHNHRNYYFDDGCTRIISDNQIGYNGKNVNLKKFGINTNYDWFSDYKDGQYEITKDDYINFYHGLKTYVQLNRQFSNLYMIKKSNTYMFFMKNLKGKLLILNGGQIKSVGEHNLDYFYQNLEIYSISIKLFLSKYNELQSKVSQEIKKIGGSGMIHGAIIDIDFYNHIYLNPLDGSIITYYALSMTEKYVYKNLQSLLNYNCPSLYSNYQQMVKNNTNELVVLNSYTNTLIVKDTEFVEDTSIYKYSRILKGLQYTTSNSIVRIWNDGFVSLASEENGKIIVTNLLLEVKN